MYQITIIEIPNATQPASEPSEGSETLPLGKIERLRQTLDVLDVSAVIRLINAPPRKKRVDAGKGSKRTPSPSANS